MKYYTTITIENIGYKEALYNMRKKGKFATRPEWDGFHFITKTGHYGIWLKTGEIILNPRERYNTDKKDWIIVEPTKGALDMLKSMNLID
jgi:hypothetical protein